MGLLPELNDDVTAEILLRVAPDEPACLLRASVVCKLWHCIISDLEFCRRYRSFHRGAPLLGFFYNLDFPETFSDDFDYPAPSSRFVATTAAFPLLHSAYDDDRHVSWALDCRHGRVLFEKADSMGLAVWDPIADDWTDLPPPGIQYASYTAVVLCDVAGCDHSDCRGGGGHFLVICIGCDATSRTVYACVYSSKDRAWQVPVSGSKHWHFYIKRPTVIGDGIYCTVRCNRDRILKYNLVERRFSWIDMPCFYKRDTVLMQNEDGSLGLVGIKGSTLYLWSRRLYKPRVGGNRRCVQWKEVKLNKILRVDNKQCINANLIGSAEGVGVVFVSTNAGVFTLELKSRRLMKVSNPSNKYPSVIPFMSFFTPDCAS